jgi:hypothetical protein
MDTRNSVAFHHCKFDLFLVNSLLKEFDNEGLALFLEISQIISSPTVVQRFVSLLSPHQNPDSLNLLVNSIYDAIERIFQRPSATFDAGTNLDLGTLHSTFVFCGWIFLESSDRFDLLDFGFPVYFENQILHIAELSVAAIDIPFHEWFLLSIGFAILERKLDLYVNESSLCIGEIVLDFNGHGTFLPGNSGPGKVGSFAIADSVSPAEINAFCTAGARAAISFTKPIVAFAPPAISNYRLTRTMTAETTTFTDVLLDVCRIEILLPLFADKRIDCCAVARLIGSALRMGEEQEKYFLQMRAPEIIAHLLVSSQAVSYQLYLEFYRLAFTLVTRPLIRAFFESILLSFDLWSRSSAFVKISEHWQVVLFGNSAYSADEVLPAPDFVDCLRMYLWFEKGGDFAMDRILSNSELTEVWSHCKLLVAEKADLDCKTVTRLLAHAIQSQDAGQVLQIVGIFQQFWRVFVHFFEAPEGCTGLLALLLSQNDDVGVATFSLIAELHRHGVYRLFSLQDHLTVISDHLKCKTVSPYYIARLTELTAGSFPELFSLLTQLAVMCGKQAFGGIFQTLTPSPQFCSLTNWAFSALHGAVLFNIPSVFAFIIKCVHDQSRLHFVMLRHITPATGKDPEHYQAQFLDVFTELILAGEVPITDTYFELVWFFLLYRPGTLHNEALLTLFGQGAPDYSCSNEASLCDLPVGEAEICPFGLRFDRQGTWRDRELALKILKLYLTASKSPKYGELMAVLAGFLSEAGERPFAVTYLSDLISENVLPSVSPMCKFAAFPSKLRFDDDANEELAQFATKMPEGILNEENRIVSRHRACTTQVLCQTAWLFDEFRFVASARERLRETFDKIQERRRKAGKAWRFLWSHLSSENGPWGGDRTQIRYKRDFSATSCLFPTRTKVNRQFDIHALASHCRDTGAILEPGQRSAFDDFDNDEEADESVGERYVLRHDCRYTKVLGAKKTTFVLTNKDIILGRKRRPLADIRYIFWRRYRFQATGLEIFFKSGKSIHLDFGTRLSRDVVRVIGRQKLPKTAIIQACPFPDFFKRLGLAKRWISGELSNFQYLLWLNLCAGRSFHDTSQYPVFPWVIADYSSSELHLEKLETYRPLDKPIGTLGTERLQELLDRMQEFRQIGVVPFLYSSYVSSPLSVFWFLIRMEPYTTMHIDMQGGKFDNSHRVFSSIGITWMSVTSQLNDYRELCPEFFYEPEFLVNANNFDLGRAAGRSIADVQLPPWAHSPMEFVYLNRKALESSFVSEQLNHWIDLIFGYKQRGELALASNNLYRIEMYDDIWDKEPLMNLIRRREIEAIVDDVGQIPAQLFTTSHESRSVVPQVATLDCPVILALAEGKCLFGFFSGELDRLTILREGNEILIVRGFNLRKSETGHEFEPPTEMRLETLHPRPQIPLDLKHCVQVSETAFAALCSNNFECVLIDSESCRKVSVGRQRITAISSADSLLSLSSSDARTHVYNLSSGKVSERFSTPTYRNSIVCSCLSQQFGVFVSGTDDKALIVALLADGSTVRVIPLEWIPQKVLITPHWGFIVVNGCKYVDGKPTYTLSVFTINGLLIKSIPFGGIVTDWIAITSPSGFDFLILSLGARKIFAFEVFFMDVGPPVYRCPSDLVCLGFSKKSNLIITLTADGKAHVIPFLTQSVEKYVA